MLLPKNQISLLIVILLFAGCQSKKSYKATDNDKKDLESVLIKEQLPDRSTQVPTDSSLYKNPGLPVMDRVLNLLSYMTLEEKIGQMTQVDRQFLESDNDINAYYLGSLLSGGGSTPPKNYPKSWAEMYDGYQKIALSTRLGIPIIYGIDAVHGHNNVIGATIFPHHIGLGCTNNPQLIEDVYRATAEEVAATGIDWDFAPSLAVPRDDRWGRTYEGFGETPDIVKSMAAAAVRGLQTDRLGGPTSILACAKHFIGDGGTKWGTGLKEKLDQGDTQISEQELREIHLPAYLPALEAGVGTIMPSYNQVNGEYCSVSKYLLTDLLKNELGFKGFLISDWQALEKMGDDYKSNIIASINAGMDMVMVPGAAKYGGQTYTNFIKLLIESVNEGSVSEKRINDAVVRILKSNSKWDFLKDHIAIKSC